MAGINKNKHLENATKHVQRGQFDRAVKELQKILEHDPEDVPVRLKVAGLLARGEKPADAMPHYDQVASHYVEKGFNARAVAVYELMVKIESQRVDLHMKLGDLYAQLMRRADALREYQIVATWFDGKGKAAESLEVLRKMAEIGPDNARVRRKLAELMVQQGQVGEAVAELQRLAETLRQKNDLAGLGDVLDRVVMLDPKSMSALRAAARVHLERRDPRRALARLQSAFAMDAHDPETLALLADAFLALGNRTKTLAVLLELAQVHDRAGELTRRDEVYREVLRHDPRNAAALDALEPVIPLTEPSHAENEAPLDYRGKAPAPSLPSGTMPIGEMGVGRLLNEAGIYIRYGIKAKAVEYIEAALDKDPACLEGNPALAAFYERALSGEPSIPGRKPPAPPPRGGFVEISVEVSQALEKMGGADFREELDEAEFFLRQELYDEAIRVFKSLVARFPKEKKIRDKLAEAERALEVERSASMPASKPAPIAGKQPLAKIELKKVPASEVRNKPKRDLEGEREIELDLGAVASLELDIPHQVSVAEVLHEMSGELDLSTGKRSNFELGMSYVELGLVDEAIAAFERAAADPDRAADARQQIGLLKLERGDVEGALKSLKKAVDLAKPAQQPAIEQSYGNALEAAGRYQEAAALYRRLLEAKNGKR